MRAVLDVLDAEPYSTWPRRDAPLVERGALLRVHAPALVDRMFALSDVDRIVAIDADTLVGPGSVRAARLAAGAALDAVKRVLAGEHRRAFCAVRPPGHHAETDRAMGFCLFNSIAVAAAAALDSGLARVAIVDFDVHHGNGSEEIFAHEPRVLYVSSHQSPLYPGTGDANGTFARNRSLPPGTGSREFRAAWSEHLLPALTAHGPELLLISAGFDGHRLDPLAGLELEADDYGWLTTELVRCAQKSAQGRIVSMLEGGYSPTALRECTAAHLLALAH